MAFVPPKDRVLEHSTTSGTGPYALGGAVDTSYNAFSASMAVGDTTIGAIIEPGVAFASGILTYSAANQITLTTTKESKGTFGSGTKEIMMGQPASSALMVDGDQSFSSAQKVQARKNLGAAPFSASAGTNIALNGAVNVSQEFGVVAGVSLASGTAKYCPDCWEAQFVHGANTAVFSFSCSLITTFGTPLAGFTNVAYLYCGTALSSPANGDYAMIRQKIEGYRIASLGWGATGAAPITYAFALYTTQAGTGFVKISNFDKSRCIYKEFTTPSGWFLVADTVDGDLSGTWNATNGIGMHFEIFLAGKAASPVAPGAWGSTNTVQTTNSTNLESTSANNLVTGLFVRPGSQLVSSLAELALLMRPIDQDLLLCQRYFETDFPLGTPAADNTQKNGNIAFTYGANAFISAQLGFYVRKRAAPTITVYSSNAKASPAAGQWQYYNGSAWVDGATTNGVGATIDNFQVQFAGTGAINLSWLLAGSWKADARL